MDLSKFSKFAVKSNKAKVRDCSEIRRRYFIRSMDHNWVKLAARLPGRALHVGVGIWFYAGLCRKRFGEPFFVSISRIARDFGIKSATARRGFKCLERNGLLSVSRKPGKKCEVTLIDPPQTAGQIKSPENQEKVS